MRRGKRAAYRGRIWAALVFLFGLLLTAFASWQLLGGWWEDAAARGEYAELREHVQSHAPNWSRLAEQNADFVGWIAVAGTSIDYPVVQGADNERYLHTTFGGQRNAAGAIFMDYRMTRGFDTPVTILYGHNMRDGSMFASLLRYLDPAFLDRHPEITIIDADGERWVYRIFYARQTHARDPIYALDFHSETEMTDFFVAAPTGTDRILVLSTCADGSNRDARVLVYAALHTERGAV